MRKPEPTHASTRRLRPDPALIEQLLKLAVEFHNK